MYTAATGKYGPFAIRYPRGNGRLADWRCPLKEVPIGRGRKIYNGTQVAVLSIGTIAAEVRVAVEKARAEGISVAWYDMVFLKPLDESILKEVAALGCRIVTVEDGTVSGGLGSAVAEWMTANGHSPEITRLGIPDSFVTQGTPAELRQLCGIDADSIHKHIVR